MGTEEARKKAVLSDLKSALSRAQKLDSKHLDSIYDKKPDGSFVVLASSWETQIRPGARIKACTAALAFKKAGEWYILEPHEKNPILLGERKYPIDESDPRANTYAIIDESNEITDILRGLGLSVENQFVGQEPAASFMRAYDVLRGETQDIQDQTQSSSTERSLQLNSQHLLKLLLFLIRPDDREAQFVVYEKLLRHTLQIGHSDFIDFFHNFFRRVGLRVQQFLLAD